MEGDQFMLRAITLARLAEDEGNLPVGAVLVLDREIVAEGRNAIWAPEFSATRHAEMEAIRAVPPALWESSQKMELHTTLEPCLMCMGSILLHRIGTVVFGSSDSYGGAGQTFHSLPPYFRARVDNTRWLGPSMQAECDPLYERVMKLVKARSKSD